MAVAALGDEPGLEQHRQVVGGQRLGQVERLGQVAGAAGAPAEVAEHEQAVGLGDDGQVLRESVGLFWVTALTMGRDSRDGTPIHINTA